MITLVVVAVSYFAWNSSAITIANVVIAVALLGTAGVLYGKFHLAAQDQKTVDTSGKIASPMPNRSTKSRGKPNRITIRPLEVQNLQSRRRATEVPDVWRDDEQREWYPFPPIQFPPQDYSITGADYIHVLMEFGLPIVPAEYAKDQSVIPPYRVYGGVFNDEHVPRPRTHPHLWAGSETNDSALYVINTLTRRIRDKEHDPGHPRRMRGKVTYGDSWHWVYQDGSGGGWFLGDRVADLQLTERLNESLGQVDQAQDSSGSEIYPPDWDSLRREVYSRDGYTCANCGSKGGTDGDTELHAHHIVPLSVGGTNTVSNLVTLCADCHAKLHPHMRD